MNGGRAAAREVKRLLWGAVPLYAGATGAFFGLLIVWANLQSGENTLSGPLAYLCGAQAAALPLFSMNAFVGKRRAAEGRRGVAAGYLLAYGIASAPIAAMAALVLPGGETWAALCGYVLTGAAMAGGCLACAALAKGRWTALALALLLMGLWQGAPEWASLLDVSPWGARLGRAILYLSPCARMNAFLNGDLDLRAALYDAALVLLALYLLGGPRPARALKGAALWALCAALLAPQPASILEIDLTRGRVTTASQEMVIALKALNLPVTVYQIAPVGAEDPWMALYLRKLSERHAYLDARVVSPREDAALKELGLEDNSLVIEQGAQWVVARYRDIYQTYAGADGQTVSFELEGTLLSALDEATGLVMAAQGAPAGRRLDQTLTMEEETRSSLAVWLVLGPALLAAAGGCLALLKKRHEH